MSGTNGATLRAATFNASLNRSVAGELVADLSTGDNAQAQTVAEIIQRAAADIVLVNEFDYVENSQALNLFRDNYLAVGQNTLGLADGGGPAADYSYGFTALSNTGITSGFDLNNNGTAVTAPGAPGYGDDALGFGNYATSTAWRAIRNTQSFTIRSVPSKASFGRTCQAPACPTMAQHPPPATSTRRRSWQCCGSPLGAIGICPC
jgi:hypothetical protein